PRKHSERGGAPGRAARGSGSQPGWRDNEGPGNRAAAELRTRRAIQVLWREQHGGVPAPKWPRRDTWRYELVALYAALPHDRSRRRTDRRSDERCASERAEEAWIE